MNVLNGNNKDTRKNPNRIIYETKYSKIEKSKICRIQPLKKLECFFKGTFRVQPPLTKQQLKLQIKKSGVFFLWNKHKIVVKPSINQNSAVSKAFWRNFLNSLVRNISFESWKVQFRVESYLLKGFSNSFAKCRQQILWS